MIIYLFKVIIELVPNPGFIYTYNDRTLLKIVPKPINKGPSWVRKARASSIFYQGPLHFNKLPASLRTFDNVSTPNSKNIDAFNLI